MGSRDKDAPHQPLLSSLVVRPSDSDGGGGGRGGSDYEPGEVRRDPPPYSRSDRYSDDPALNVAWCKNWGLEDGIWILSYCHWHLHWSRTFGYIMCIMLPLFPCSIEGCLFLEFTGFFPGYRIRAGSGSPVRRRNADHQYSPDFDNSSGPLRSRGVGNGRDAGRYRASSPSYGRGRGGDRSFGRGFDGPGFGSGPFRGEGMNRSNPNVRPREGDWYCSDPACNNLNFARREYCNTCKRHRYGPGGSPRRGYPGPPPPPYAPPRRFSGPPGDRSPGRNMNGYRSPPRGWARDGPREFGGRGPFHPRHEGRFPDHRMRRDRPDYPEEDFRERNKFDRPTQPDWDHRVRGRENIFNDRKGYDRRPPSPPLVSPPHRGRWANDVRERSRSPIRGGGPPKDFRRDMYMDRGRDDRRGVVRDRVGGAY